MALGQIIGPTLTNNAINYSGMFFSMTDDETRFLDSIRARGRNGGSVITNSIEHILANTYKHRDPKQPEISEQTSLTAPEPTTTPREQATNVVQMYHETVTVSYTKQSNFDALGGVNLANAVNERPDELDTQVGHKIIEMRRDLNYTLINGVYQYTPGSTTIAPMTRGIINGITTNKYDFTGVPLNDVEINRIIMKSIANGLVTQPLEIWVNPEMMIELTQIYALLPGASLPPSRTEGGIAYDRLVTSFGTLMIHWEPLIPNHAILFVNMSQMAVAEKPYISEEGENMGVFFYEPIAKLGAAERGQIFGEVGLDYGAENKHAMIVNIE